MTPGNAPRRAPILFALRCQAELEAGDARVTAVTRADPRCSVAIMADDTHIVPEGTALPLRGDAMVEQVAEAYRSKYN